MARKGRNKSTGERDDYYIASPTAAPRTAFVPSDDRRRYHPERAERPALTVSGNKAKIGLTKWTYRTSPPTPSNGRTFQYLGGSKKRELDRVRIRAKADARKQTKQSISFVAPSKVLVCIRRKMRREVLHALRRFGGSGSRRRSWRSEIRC